MLKLLTKTLFIVIIVILYSPALCSESWFEQGLSDLNSHQNERAIEAFTRVLETKPTSAKAYNNRGLAWFNMGDYNQAMADFNNALKIEPRNAEILGNRGIIWFSKGKYDLAIDDYDKALGIDPNFAKAYTNRGAAWFCKGNYDLAIADYLKALEIDPNCTETHRQLTWIQAKVSDRTEKLKHKKINATPKTRPSPFVEERHLKDSKALQGKIIPPPKTELMVQKPFKNQKQLKPHEKRLPRQPSQPNKKIATKPFMVTKQQESPVATATPKEKTGASSKMDSQKTFSIQIGAFASRERAEKWVAIMRDKGYSVRLQSFQGWGKNILHAVRIGKYADPQEAKDKAAAFTEKEKMETTVRPTNEL